MLTNKTTKKILLRYLPLRLSRKDKKKQSTMLLKSRKLYKKGYYYSRKPVKSFKSKKSQHIIDAEKLYDLDKIVVNDELAKKTGCTKKSLQKIVSKGEGAYYSSGSRPNQTAQSWGIARLASSVSGGKAASIDFSILEEGCRENSIALKLAKKAKQKYMKKTRKMPKTKIF
jgi:DNA-binding Xre family transcriptional regulator